MCVYMCDYCTVHSGSRDCVKPDKDGMSWSLLPERILTCYFLFYFPFLSSFNNQFLSLLLSRHPLCTVSLSTPVNPFILLHTPHFVLTLPRPCYYICLYISRFIRGHNQLVPERFPYWKLCCTFTAHFPHQPKMLWLSISRLPPLYCLTAGDVAPEGI